MPRRALSVRAVAFAVSLFAVVAAVSCHRVAEVPDPSSKDYLEAVRAFYVGLAALEVGDDARAENRLQFFTSIAPGEPSGWANYGLLAMRHREFDKAAERLEKAREMAADD